MKFLPKWIVVSKTFGLNALLLAAGLLEFFAGHPIVTKHPDLVTVFVALGVTLNWIVRTITNQPVTLLPPPIPTLVEEHKAHSLKIELEKRDEVA